MKSVKQLRAAGLATMLALATTVSAAPDIITGVYATYGTINVHNATGSISWTWQADTNTQGTSLPTDLINCIKTGNSATEVKWAGANKIVALIGYSALLISYTPNVPATDKKVLFGLCTTGSLGNAHTAELLPDNLFAVATTGQNAGDGFQLFDAAAGPAAHPSPLQTVSGQPAVHALVWDGGSSSLWAAGTDKGPDNHSGMAKGNLNKYLYNPTTKRFDTAPTIYVVPNWSQLQTEWGTGPYGQWWDGPHDLVRLPNERKFLLSTDRDVVGFDITAGKFIKSTTIASQYLAGFQPQGTRSGTNGQGQSETLPRSDCKSISVYNDGTTKNVLVVQAIWQTTFGNRVRRLVGGSFVNDIQFSQIYRSRYFAAIPGWVYPS